MNEESKVFKEVETPTKTDLINRLEGLPDLIRLKELEVMNFSNNASLNETDVKEREALIMTEIATEQISVKNGDSENPTWKKKYPNDNARQGELNKRLIGDKAYNKIHENWEHNKEKKQKSEIQLKFLQNSFNATKFLVKLVCDYNSYPVPKQDGFEIKEGN